MHPLDSLPQYSRRTLLDGILAAAKMIREEEARDAARGAAWSENYVPPIDSEAGGLWSSLVQYVECLEARRRCTIVVEQLTAGKALHVEGCTTEQAFR